MNLFPRAIKIILVLVMLLIYVLVNVPGLRTLAPPLAEHLTRSPLLSWMADYEGFDKADVAFVLGVPFAVISCFCAIKLMRVLLGADADGTAAGHTVTLALGSLAVLLDMITFYLGIAGRTGGWDEEAVSFSAILLTLMYGTCLLGLAYYQVTIELKTVKGTYHA